MWLVARTHGAPESIAAAARQAVRAMDPLLGITTIRPYDEIVSESIADRRFSMILLGIFGSVALTLAAIGIYGIMAYSVKRRTREIGIRMALGGRPRDVLRLVVGQGMRLTLIGLLLGAIAAFLATRLMSTMLYGVSPNDPLTFVAAVALLAVIAWIASWLPARRAIATNPTSALRAD
jgi:putative ABC transport system permease protein